MRIYPNFTAGGGGISVGLLCSHRRGRRSFAGIKRMEQKSDSRGKKKSGGERGNG